MQAKGDDDNGSQAEIKVSARQIGVSQRSNINRGGEFGPLAVISDLAKTYGSAINSV